MDEVTEFGDEGDGDDELHPAQGLDGLDHGGQAPVAGVVLEFGLQALQPVLLFSDGADILLEDDLLGGGVARPLQPASADGPAPQLALPW